MANNYYLSKLRQTTLHLLFVPLFAAVTIVVDELRPLTSRPETCAFLLGLDAKRFEKAPGVALCYGSPAGKKVSEPVLDTGEAHGSKLEWLHDGRSKCY